MTTNTAIKNYRPDIDGLRAVSVLGVVFFHVFPEWLPGGFLGVDVFFVISGYLITKHLLHPANGKISLIEFYDRRIRRILPALFVMVAVVTIISYIVFIPFPEYFRFSQSLVSVTFMLSNIYFYVKSDYFDIDAREIPLLHTWSLSIEEQFYIIWPLLIIAINLIPKWKIRTGVIIGLFSLSILYSQYLATFNRSAAFYWMPSRAWELLTGALLAIDFIPQIKKPLYAHFTASLGVAMVVASFFILNSESRIPGFLSLLPVGGAALFIEANKPKNPTAGFITKWLTQKPILFIGLISYSLYLWHWPILAFMHTLWGDLTPGLITIALSSSFLFAWLSYRYVEQPVRKIKPALSFTFGLSLVIIGLLSSFAFYGHFKKGIPDRVPNEIRNTVNYFLPLGPGDCAYLHSQMERKIKNPKHKVVVAGDSHSEDLCPVFKTIGENDSIDFVLESRSGCLPIEYEKNSDFGIRCNANFNRLLQLSNDPSISMIILVYAWNGHAESLTDSKKEITQAITKLAKSKPLLIIGDVPFFETPVTQCVVRKAMLRSFDFLTVCQPTFLSAIHTQKQQSAIYQIVQELKKKSIPVEFFDRLPQFCKQDCQTFYDDIPLYRDSNHLTYSGAMVSYQPLREFLQEELK